MYGNIFMTFQDLNTVFRPYDFLRRARIRNELGKVAGETKIPSFISA